MQLPFSHIGLLGKHTLPKSTGRRLEKFSLWWLPLIPGLPIVLCSLAFNYIGDGLRDALDPRLKL